MDSYQPAPMSSGLDDLLGLGSDGLLGDVGGTSSSPIIPAQASLPEPNIGGIFGAPPQVPIHPPSVFPFAQVCFSISFIFVVQPKKVRHLSFQPVDQNRKTGSKPEIFR